MIKVTNNKKLLHFFPILIFILLALVYYLTSPGDTPYDYFTRLANAFLQGKYWVTENPPWLSELIPVSENMFYVVYPPMPAIVLSPLILLFGELFQQQYLAHLMGAGTSVLTYFYSLKITKDKKIAVFMSLLSGFGSIIWFLSSVGSSWYLGQISACFFLSFAIYESLGKKKGILIGLLLGAAYLSRVNLLFTVPFVILLTLKSFKPDLKNIKKVLEISIGFLPFFIANCIYNYVRYGVIFDQGYFLLPKLLHEENTWWFVHGVMHPLYIPRNLKVAFTSLPKIMPSAPYIFPSWSGLSIWFTTPVFLVSFLAPIKKRLTKILWAGIFFSFLFVAMHGATGFAQFGYRFAVDFYPLLFPLVVLSIKKTGLKRYHLILLFVSVLVNLWGVLFINKFGWVVN